jgi:hypothetical protein
LKVVLIACDRKKYDILHIELNFVKTQRSLSELAKRGLRAVMHKRGEVDCV